MAPASLSAALTGTMFIDMKINKLTIRNTPIERIDDYVFYGVNETLRELELINTMLSTFPPAIKVSTIHVLLARHFYAKHSEPTSS